MSIWADFENMVNVEEVKEAQQNTFEKPSAGIIRVSLMSVAPKVAQNGAPMINVVFKNVENNKLIGHNLFVTNTNDPSKNGWVVARAVSFLTDLTMEEYTFTSLSALSEYCTKMPLGAEYEIEISYRVNYNGVENKYPDIKVLKKLIKIDDGFEVTDEMIPFA